MLPVPSDGEADSPDGGRFRRRRSSVGGSSHQVRAHSSSGGENSASPRPAAGGRRLSVGGRRQSVGGMRGGRRASTAGAANKDTISSNRAVQSAANAEHGQFMMAAASKIQSAVTTLYKTGPAGEPRKRTKGGASKKTARSGGSKKGGASDVRGSVRSASKSKSERKDTRASKLESSSSESSDSADAQGNLDDDDTDSEEYDFKGAAKKVHELLDGLKTEQRTEIMEFLNNWYGDRLEAVEKDAEDLVAHENDFIIREDEMKDSMKQLAQSLEEKQMREVKVLVSCHHTLHNGATRKNKPKRRRRFAHGADTLGNGGYDEEERARRKQERKLKTAATLKAAKAAASMGKGDTAAPPSREITGEAEAAATPATALRSSLVNRKASHSADDGKSKGVSFGGSSTQRDASSSDDGSEYDSDGLSENQDASDKEASVDPTTALDPLDVEGARKKLKEMHEDSQRVLGALSQEEASPADVLNSLAVVQEGQLHLEKQATLAKQHCDTLRAAVESLTEGNDNADPAVTELLSTMREQAFAEGNSFQTGPDPEELEEECKQLELLVEKQQRDIDEYRRRRERNHTMAEARAQTQDLDSDDSQEEPVTAKQPSKKASRKSGSETRGSVKRESSKGRDSPKSGGKPGGKRTETDPGDRKHSLRSADTERAFTGSEGVHDLQDPGGEADVGELQQKIDERQAAIMNGRRMLLRMRKEYDLLKYCTELSNRGLEAIVEEFNPPSTFVNDNEIGMEEDVDVDDDTGWLKKGAGDDTGSKGAEDNDKAGAGSKGEAAKLAEERLKQSIAEMNAQVQKDTGRIKDEKNRQKNLKKDIAAMRKKYKMLTKNDPTAPSTLDGLKKQMAGYEENDRRLRSQIIELQQELDTQNNLLERARAEQKEIAEQKKNQPAAQATQGDLGVPAELEAPTSSPSPQLLTSSPSPQPPPGWATMAAGTQESQAAADVSLRPGASPAARRASADIQPVDFKSKAAGEHPSLSARSSPAPSASPQPAQALDPHQHPGASPQPGLGALSRSSPSPQPHPAASPQPGLSAPSRSESRASAIGEGQLHISQAPRKGTLPAKDGGEHAKIANAAQEELAELLKLQSKNEDLRQEIEEISKKMAQLRKATKQGKSINLSKDMLRDILGISAEMEDAKPPPEYYQLKKEVRHKQDQVRALRKKWWADHKDLDALAEKVRQQVQASGGTAFAFSRSDGATSTGEAAAAGGPPQGQMPAWIQSLAGLAGGATSESEQATPGSAATRRASSLGPGPVGALQGTLPKQPGEMVYGGHRASLASVPARHHHGPVDHGGEHHHNQPEMSPKARFAQVQRHLKRSLANTGEVRGMEDLLVSGSGNH